VGQNREIKKNNNEVKERDLKVIRGNSQSELAAYKRKRRFKKRRGLMGDRGG